MAEPLSILDTDEEWPPPERDAIFGFKSKVMYPIMASLIIFLVALILLGMVQTTSRKLAGHVVDLSGNPVSVEVFVLGRRNSTLSEPDGSFVLPRVPAGEQTLIVAYGYEGSQFPVRIPRMGKIDIGQLQIDTINSGQ